MMRIALIVAPASTFAGFGVNCLNSSHAGLGFTYLDSFD